MHRILVAEDDDSARLMIARYLEGKGHTVIAVPDGQHVLDLVAKEEFDLILLDVMMPRVSGFDVLATLRSQGDITPIIMATAAASPDDVVKALTLGADDYVTKPFSFPVLMARIDLRMRLRPQGQSAVTGPIRVDASDSIESEEPVVEESGILQRLKRALKKSVRPPTQELTPGTVVADRYVVGEKIGEGGFGAVFKARHVDLGQDVAIKVLHPGAGTSVSAFRREAQNACRVRHHNAVRVFDFGVLPGSSAFLVMELLEGPTLEQLCQTGPTSVERAAGIARSVLAALAAAHKQGLVHRDVKAQNVVLHKEDGREQPKLLDFGIAKLIDEGKEGNVILGSAAYIAPERLRAEPYDGRADVYACGIMLYRMMAGRFPFDASIDDFEALAHWHLHTLPERGKWSDGVDKVVKRLLDKDPAKRPTAAEAEALVAQLVWDG